MSRIRRRLTRWRNYFSTGDYAGSGGGQSNHTADSHNANRTTEVFKHPPGG